MRRLYPFLITILTVCSVAVLKIALNHLFQAESPYLLFFSAVLLSSLWGGAWQGAFATVLSLLFAANIFSPPAGTGSWFDHVNVVRTFFFTFDCLVIASISGALRRSRLRAHAALRDVKSAQESVLINEARFRSIFDSNMIGLFISESDGQIIDANDYFLNMLGYTRSEILDEKVDLKKITSSDDHEKNLQSRDELVKNRKAQTFESNYIKKNGEKVPVLIGSMMSERDGVVVSYVLDISERKRNEKDLENAKNALEERVIERTQELRQSQHFLDSVIENIPNMIFVKDAVTLRFVRFNKAGEDLLGEPRQNLLGKNDFDFFPSEQAEAFTKKDRETLSGKKVVDIPEEPLTTKHGLRYLHTKKIPMLGSNGEPLYLMGISEDITEKKESEHQRLSLLREQVARVEAEKIAERLVFFSEASAVLNESLNLKTMLKSFARVITTKMADWCVVDLVSEEGVQIEHIAVSHRNPTKAAWAQDWRQKHPLDWNAKRGSPRVIKTGQPELYKNITKEILRASVSDEESLQELLRLGMCSAMIVPLKASGKVIGALTFVTSESQRAYDEIDLSIAEDLAKRAFFAIENARLYDKSLEASRAKSAFLANVSHEIRTPLGAMLGFAELISEEGELSSNQKTSVSTILRNGRQLLQIVDEILDLSKIESERIQIENMRFSIFQVLDEVMSLLRPQAVAKGLQFEMTKSLDLAESVVSDPTRFRQILINVIGNAIKFTDRGQVQVQVKSVPSKVHLGRKVIEVAVTDSGIGINIDQQAELFQAFVQADNSMTRRFGGTGLGLFLSRKLARLLGGDVVLNQSEIGKGSQFLVTIEVSLPIENKNSSAPILSHADSGRNLKGRILIIDDSEDNRLLVMHYLARLGLVGEMASGGHEGIEKALAQPYDVILMDLQMPKMDGFETLRFLRQQGYRRPIIALTAHAMKGDREQCLENGFDEYLCKPLSKEDLQETLMKFLRPGISI